jgi:hypothetical protein
MIMRICDLENLVCKSNDHTRYGRYEPDPADHQTDRKSSIPNQASRTPDFS